MKLVKSFVLGLALFGCFAAGVGALLKILTPLVTVVGAGATLYIVGMIALLTGIVVKLMYVSIP
jgi:hypothetical protein